MDQTQARALLAGERARLQRLLQAATAKPQPAALGDEVDDADRRNAEQTGRAVDQLLQARWAALQRAEAPARRRQLRPFGIDNSAPPAPLRIPSSRWPGMPPSRQDTPAEHQPTVVAATRHG